MKLSRILEMFIIWAAFSAWLNWPEVKPRALKLLASLPIERIVEAGVVERPALARNAVGHDLCAELRLPCITICKQHARQVGS